MRRITAIISVAICSGILAMIGVAQEVFTNDKLEYSFELPSPTWKSISELGQPEFVYGDRLDGYLRVRKEVVDAGTRASDVARRDQDQKHRFFPGFVEGKEEPFNGRLDGVTISYEYVKAGKPMLGRVYYLQADPRTVYMLHFTGLKDKLSRIRNQTDLIARTFKLK